MKLTSRNATCHLAIGVARRRFDIGCSCCHRRQLQLRRKRMMMDCSASPPTSASVAATAIAKEVLSNPFAATMLNHAAYKSPVMARPAQFLFIFISTIYTASACIVRGIV